MIKRHNNVYDGQKSLSLISVIFAVWNAFPEFGLQHSHDGCNDTDFASDFCCHQIKSDCQ